MIWVWLPPLFLSFLFSFCFGFTCHSCLIWGLVVGVCGLFQGSNWSLLWEGMNRCDHFSSDSVGCFEFWFWGCGVEWFGVCLQLGPETLYLSPVFLFSSSFYVRTWMFYLFPSFLGVLNVWMDWFAWVLLSASLCDYSSLFLSTSVFWFSSHFILACVVWIYWLLSRICLSSRYVAIDLITWCKLFE